VLSLVKLILEGAGYVVLAAGNGQQALALCENGNHPIDLLLTDINMPDICGPELACRVCKTAPRLPVMFMTGRRADTHGIEFLRRDGPFSDCAVISKPFNPPELISQVAAAFSTAPR